MLRSTIAILILFLYIPSAIGMNMNIHYCGGKIASIDFGFVTNEGCTCGNTSHVKGARSSCCKDVHVKCELKSKQNASKSNVVAESSSHTIAVLPLLCSVRSSCVPCLLGFSCSAALDPPDLAVIPLHKRNRVFRI